MVTSPGRKSRAHHSVQSIKQKGRTLQIQVECEQCHKQWNEEISSRWNPKYVKWYCSQVCYDKHKQSAATE